MLLNKHGETAENENIIIKDVDGLTLHDDQILPYAYWLTQKAEIKQKLNRVSIWLDSHDDIEALSDDLSSIDLIALNFPKFGDGRAFTMAHLLQDKFGFKGEIRAIGHPIADQAQFLFRCGVDSIDIPAAQDPAIWVKEATRMSRFYQRSAENITANSKY
ncbi:MAG: oxidoreductase [Hyphomicrobiales bacterium]|nr:MAG: oxidoreductase [Hyphomicrobiales bacterium]